MFKTSIITQAPSGRFHFVGRVHESLCNKSFETIADVGCAAGAFPNYLKARFPNQEIVGIELLDYLRLKAENDFREKHAFMQQIKKVFIAKGICQRYLFNKPHSKLIAKQPKDSE